jgi:hypothetical protein
MGDAPGPVLGVLLGSGRTHDLSATAKRLVDTIDAVLLDHGSEP